MTSSIASAPSIVAAKIPALPTPLTTKTEAANLAKATKAQAAEITKAAKATAAAAKAAQAQAAVAAKAAAAAAKASAAQALKDAKAVKTTTPKTPDLGLYNQNGSIQKTPAAQAATSDQVIAGGGDIVVEIKNSDSGYNNKIYWSSDNFKTRNYLGIDNQTGTYNIGKFSAGTKIDFGIENDFGQFFKAGAPSNNVDNVEHAKFTKTTEGTLIGFEDLYGGGDKDFNDAIISVKTLVTPVPIIQTGAPNTSTNRSGLGDGTNPGQGSGTNNATNQGTNNPNNVNAYLTQAASGGLLKTVA
ncbi:MAG: DUF4114 domain-containing protein [Gammaproteobacteria bacterium]|nr:MAG: DUF4114 domain-containing protein [Gammaproteobacteria bacterium]